MRWWTRWWRRGRATATRCEEARSATAAPAAGAPRRRRERPSASAADVDPTRPLAAAEEAVLQRIADRIEARQLHLPPLSTTAVRLLGVLGERGYDVADVVDVVATDPILCSDLLRTASSALFGGVPAPSLRDAITRLGERRLRARIYAASLQGTVLGCEALAEQGAEVLRQSYTDAALAQTIAIHLGKDPDEAYLLGLLHDLGRLALLPALDVEARELGGISRELIGRVFNRFHEAAGAALARHWKLSDEIASVAGCHHLFERNTDHPQSAALASLAHRLELLHRRGASEDELRACPELDALHVGPATRHTLLGDVAAAFEVLELDEPVGV